MFMFILVLLNTWSVSMFYIFFQLLAHWIVVQRIILLLVLVNMQDNGVTLVILINSNQKILFYEMCLNRAIADGYGGSQVRCESCVHWSPESDLLLMTQHILPKDYLPIVKLEKKG